MTRIAGPVARGQPEPVLSRGRHGIPRQPDITFRAFAEEYLRDYAAQHNRSADRDPEIIAVLNRTFGSLILHEITPPDSPVAAGSAGRHVAHHGQRGAAKPVKPGRVNRELDTPAGDVLARRGVEEGYSRNPCAAVKRLRLENLRDRILTPEEQRSLINAAPPQVRAVITPALLTAAGIGELLDLPWMHAATDVPVFPNTKNGHERRIALSKSIRTVLDELPKTGGYVFTNARTQERYTRNDVRHRQAVVRRGWPTRSR